MVSPIAVDDRMVEPVDPLVTHRRQRRRRRLLVLAGALLIAVPGGLWAALSKDPIRGAGRDNPEVVFDRGIEVEQDVFVDEAPLPLGIPAPFITPAPALP